MKWINKMFEKRQNETLRQEFERTLINVRDILSCYDKEIRNKVLLNYLNAYNVLTNDEVRGRLIMKLVKEGVL